MARRFLGFTALVLSAGLALADSPTQAADSGDAGLGRVAQFDITTTDLAQAQDFYGKLLGWTFAPVPHTHRAVRILSGGDTIGFLRVAEGKISAFNGVNYFQVADMVASCAKAKELGGTVSEGFPFNKSGGSGSIAVGIDPAGHPFGLYSRTLVPAPK
jgi:predicted enzyme related to lactoylglutathione lyase